MGAGPKTCIYTLFVLETGPKMYFYTFCIGAGPKIRSHTLFVMGAGPKICIPTLFVLSVKRLSVNRGVSES